MTKTEAKWASRVQAWRSSGKTAEAFVAGQGYKAATLRWHTSRLRSGAPLNRERSQDERGTAVVLARVVRVGSPTAALTITVGAARIEVMAGFEPGLLRAVVACLGGGS